MDWQNVRIDWKALLFTFANCAVFTVYMLVDPADSRKLLKPLLDRSTDPPPSPVVSRPSPTPSPPPVPSQPSPSPQVEVTPSPVSESTPELAGQLGQISHSKEALKHLVDGMTRADLEQALIRSGWRAQLDEQRFGYHLPHLGHSWIAPDGNSSIFISTEPIGDKRDYAVAFDADEHPINIDGERHGSSPPYFFY